MIDLNNRSIYSDGNHGLTATTSPARHGTVENLAQAVRRVVHTVCCRPDGSLRPAQLVAVRLLRHVQQIVAELDTGGDTEVLVKALFWLAVTEAVARGYISMERPE